MRTSDTFRQYIWLVNTIKRSGKITLKRIQQRWIEDDLNDRKSLSRTTFYRLKLAIEDMFGICIECDPADNHQYYINNPESLTDNSTQSWMFRTLSINNILLDGLAIKDQLLLENIPAGSEFLPVIINAIKQKKTLSMGYKKFNDSNAYTTLIQPYCLKVFHQRWYLLGKSERNDYQTAIYSLDRMTELVETDVSYTMDPDFDAEAFFNKFYGVFINEDKSVERIVLRAYPPMTNYLRTLPLHHSQKEITSTTEYSDFEYYLAPTFDLQQAILKEGSELEVLEPQSFRNEIKKELTRSISRYKKQIEF